MCCKTSSPIQPVPPPSQNQLMHIRHMFIENKPEVRRVIFSVSGLKGAQLQQHIRSLEVMHQHMTGGLHCQLENTQFKDQPLDQFFPMVSFRKCEGGHLLSLWPLMPQ